MSLHDRVEDHPVYWLAVAFSAGIAFVAMLATIFGLEAVRRGTYVLREDVANQYIRRDSISNEFIQRSSLSDYVPRTELSANYVPRSEVASRYVSREDVQREYLQRSIVSEEFVPRREVNAQYVRREALSRDYLPKDVIARDYVLKRDVELEFIRKSDCAKGGTKSPTVDAPNTSAKNLQRAVRFQEFPQVRVEVTRLQSASRDGTATAILRYVNKTNDTLKVVLCAGFCGDNKTFLINADGHEYHLTRASGIAQCCYGFAGGDPQGGILEVPPAGQATATLVFEARRSGVVSKQGDSSFSLTSEQMIGDMVETRQWGLQWRKSRTLSVSIQDIVP